MENQAHEGEIVVSGSGVFVLCGGKGVGFLESEVTAKYADDFQFSRGHGIRISVVGVCL